MEITETINFISKYGLASVIAAIIICCITIIADIFLKDRIPALVKVYAPFVIGTAVGIVYGLIKLGKNFYFTEEYISSGLLIGSLSTIFYSIFNRIKESKTLLLKDGLPDKYFLLAENVVKEFVLPESINSVSETVSKLLEEFSCFNSDDTLLKDNIVAEIIKNKKPGITEKDVKNAVSILIEYAKKL